MEVFAGYRENADWNVGRLLDAIEELGDLDDTLIVYIWGDNGASMEGTVTGSFNETTFFNGVVLDADEQLRLIEKYGGIEELGGVHTAPHFAAAWAHANNTPFKWGKQTASHLGGTRNPMVVAWPNRIPADGGPALPVHPRHRPRPHGPRSGRHPRTQDRRRDRPGADGRHQLRLQPRRRRRRGAAHGPVLRDVRGPRDLQGRLVGVLQAGQAPLGLLPGHNRAIRPGGRLGSGPDVWELYYLPDDFSQAHDLAAEHPDKVAELQDLFWERGRTEQRPAADGRVRRSSWAILPPLPTVTRFAFAGDVQNIQRGMAPRIQGRSYAIEAELHVPEDGAEGVIVANADFIGGFAVWVDNHGLLHHTYPWLGVETYQQTSTEPIPPATSRSRCCSKPTNRSPAPAET